MQWGLFIINSVLVTISTARVIIQDTLFLAHVLMHSYKFVLMLMREVSFNKHMIVYENLPTIKTYFQISLYYTHNLF